MSAETAKARWMRKHGVNIRVGQLIRSIVFHAAGLIFEAYAWYGAEAGWVGAPIWIVMRRAKP